jgi:hypothetical protein
MLSLDDIGLFTMEMTQALVMVVNSHRQDFFSFVLANNMIV